LSSAFSRMQQVLRTTTSAASGSVVGSIPCSARRPAIRSESCSFIWHRRCARGSGGPHSRQISLRGAGGATSRPSGSLRSLGEPGAPSAPGALDGTVATLRPVDVTVAGFLVAVAVIIFGSIVQGTIGFGLGLLSRRSSAIAIPEAIPVVLVMVAWPIGGVTAMREHHALDHFAPAVDARRGDPGDPHRTLDHPPGVGRRPSGSSWASPPCSACSRRW